MRAILLFYSKNRIVCAYDAEPDGLEPIREEARAARGAIPSQSDAIGEAKRSR